MEKVEERSDFMGFMDKLSMAFDVLQAVFYIIVIIYLLKNWNR